MLSEHHFADVESIVQLCKFETNSSNLLGLAGNPNSSQIRCFGNICIDFSPKMTRSFHCFLLFFYTRDIFFFYGQSWNLKR